MARTYTTDENRVRLQKLIDERDDLSPAMQKLAWRIAAVRSAITRQT